MLQAYLPLLLTHATLAVVSPVLFSMRALRAIRGLDPARGWLRVAPHIVDSFLLLAGLALAFTIRQYPFVHGWLTAKLLALILYIVLGHVAVRRARTKRARIAAWLAALCVVLYIYGVAITHSPTLSIGPG